ncbi:aa3-type cytochrome c oxidase subunit IV [Sphingomonas sp.]|jgi:hypothetical protein|nr:aa3-type cytochrome c oxidase subunit IV [Sphingomonas sp.]HEX4695677.1 aa3-type cytochrome c oxidase subunit IV [Sphingomonas sp.]
MASDTDLKPHQQTYHSVLGLLKYGAVSCLVVAAIVIWLISSGGK